MRSYEFPYPEAEQQTVVSRFGGIDCRTHPTKVSLSRSPDMQNMICDQNDFLVKRTGWHTQAQFNAPIYGLFAMPDGVGCAVHAGAKLYFRAPDGTQTELCADMNEAFSQSFTMKGVLYLMDGKTYRAVRKSSKNTVWEAVPVSGTAYVPTTTISAAPTGGGTSYEAVNLLTPKRINTFIGDGTATQFKVDATDLDETAVTAEVNGSGDAGLCSGKRKRTGECVHRVCQNRQRTRGQDQQMPLCRSVRRQKRHARVPLRQPGRAGLRLAERSIRPDLLSGHRLHPHGYGCICDRRLSQTVRKSGRGQVRRRTRGDQLSAHLHDGG